MSKKNKILLLFPDGVGIRNYLYSDVFKNNNSSELILFHNFDSETEADVKKRTGISEAVQIPKYKESLKEKFLRELICLSRLYHNAKKTANPTILTNWNREHKGFSKKTVYKTIEFIAPFIKNYKTIVRLESAYQKAIRENEFYKEIKTILENVQPDTLFCSHQRALQAATIFAAAQDLGIKTTTVIFSWDNLPKARMALRADKYLVWSDYMKKEIALYYPEIQQSAVYVTGTPQFEFYNNPANIIDKQTFYEKYNLDPAKKIICFSGDDVKTSPDDPKYLEDIADELITSGLQNNYQILLRRCPVDLSERYKEVIKKYGNLIKEASPLWMFKNSKEWTAVYPSFDDVPLLISTVYYSDIVVNVGSTMAFDFSMFEKPCVFINYDQEQKNVSNWSVDWIYELQHFRSMPNRKAVFWFNKKEDFISLLQSDYNEQAMSDWRNIVLGVERNPSVEIQNVLNL